jgi:hypothetical protein
VQEDHEIDTSNPMSPGESRKGPDIDYTLNINYLKRCYVFHAFVDMNQTHNDIWRALPAKLHTAANSGGTADLLAKVSMAKTDVMAKISKWAFAYAL